MSIRRGALVPGSEDKLDNFKEKVASELGVEISKVREDGLWGRIPAERCGEVGGSMVKRMIESYEKNLIK